MKTLNCLALGLVTSGIIVEMTHLPELLAAAVARLHMLTYLVR